MTGKCWRCGKRGHFAADCWKAERARRLHAYWDQVAPLPPIAAAWAAPRAAAPRTPAQIAREVRLMTLAAEQVAESRAARGVPGGTLRRGGRDTRI